MLFKALHKFGENHQNAFESLPRSVKSLYTHSLQSYIWNRIASRRLREKGLELCEGDFVGRRI
jgi:tRNA pseudouridine13 synthase